MNRSEQTAAALEASLTNLESKLDEILASFGDPVEDDQDSTAEKDGGNEDADLQEKAAADGKNGAE